MICVLFFMVPVSVASAACSHNNITDVGEVGCYYEYEQYTSSDHWRTVFMNFRCLDCGYSYTMQWNTDYFPHKFSGNKCTQCGYNRSSNTPSGDNETTDSSPSELPSTIDLQDAAQELLVTDRKQIIGATAKVVYGTNVREDPSDTSLIIGKISPDEKYNIIDATPGYNGNVWLKIKYGRRYGWISASFVVIVPNAPDLAGQKVTITIVSGNARSTPSVAADKVGTVYRGEKYTILDCDYDPFGKLWYKIRIGNSNGWISSGLAELR